MSLQVKQKIGAVKKLHHVLQKHLKEKVLLTITDNATTFLTANYVKKKWRIRLHWMFLKADRFFWSHLARFINTHEKASSRLIDRYIEDHWHWVHHRMPPIVTKGKIYNLEKIFVHLNRHFLKNRVTAKITWGQKVSRRSYEQLQMGSYSTSRNLITIHPHLDQKFVPKFVVEATVFHEMCHAVLPVRKVNGRREIHPHAFKKLEAKYPHLAKAQKWEEKNLNRLLQRPK